MLANLPEASGNAAQFVYPAVDAVPCSTSLPPAQTSHAKNGCMQAMHANNINNKTSTQPSRQCWLANLKGMRQRYLKSNAKCRRFRKWSSVDETPAQEQGQGQPQASGQPAASQTQEPPAVGRTPAPGAQASTSTGQRNNLNSNHASRQVRESTSQRYAMLCSAVQRDGDEGGTCMALPSEAAIVCTLRRAARKYSVQLSTPVLEASGLYPLECLHEVRYTTLFSPVLEYRCRTAFSECSFTACLMV